MWVIDFINILHPCLVLGHHLFKQQNRDPVFFWKCHPINSYHRSNCMQMLIRSDMMKISKTKSSVSFSTRPLSATQPAADKPVQLLKQSEIFHASPQYSRFFYGFSGVLWPRDSRSKWLWGISKPNDPFK